METLNEEPVKVNGRLLSIKEQTELAAQRGPLTPEERDFKDRLLKEIKEYREKTRWFGCESSDPDIAEQQTLLRRLSIANSTSLSVPQNGEEKGSLRLH